MTLAELITTHNLETDKNSTHSYCDYFYDEVFINYKDKDIVLVEVGTHKGGSAILWDKYFSKKKIYSIDITVCNVLKQYTDIIHISKNAYFKEVIEQIPNFDIFIEDGSHSLETQLLAIDNYLPKLNKDGIFIIEDVQNYAHFQILDKFTQLKGQYKTDYIDLRIIKNRYDDLLFVVYG